jgi:hypothetical protein
MENSTRTTAPTFESVWASLQETDRQRKENEREMKEIQRLLSEKVAVTDRIVQETARQMKETDRKMLIIQKEMGRWANNQGSFAEEYFFNSFENGKRNFFGEQFDKIGKNVKAISKNLEDEYDIVMYNGTSVAIIEVKFKAHKDHVPQLLKKAETFRILYPYYQGYKIYLGLASMSFHPEVEDECLTQGIVVIKQVGDTVVIHDEHLKIW